MHRAEPVKPTTDTVAGAELAERLHEHLDVEAAAYVLVNEARRLLDADRASVLLRRRRRWTVAAVSGQDLIDRRANFVSGLETLIAAVAPLNQPLVYDGGNYEGAPQIEAALGAFLDLTQARQLAAVPIRATLDADAKQTESDTPAEPETLAWLVVERFTLREPATSLGPATERIAATAAPALRNASRYTHLPFRRVGQFVERVTAGRLPSRGLAILGAIVVAGLVLTFFPATLRVEAEGVMQPQHRRHVFAPVDGVVVELNARQGQNVAAGEKLLTMRRPELDYELTRVGGEIQTQEKRLSSVQAARLRGSSNLEPDELARLTAEEVEVKQQLEGLRKQLAELQRQQESLVVVAPIAGQVLTWDVERQLASRPVQKGMILLTVGDVAGPWELELQIPDEYSGYVRRRFSEKPDAPPTVEYVSAAVADQTYRATLREVAPRSDVDAAGRATVVGVAELEKDVPRTTLHPAAAVSAKIDCGRTSLGYAWFVDVIHLLRTRLFF